MKNRYLVLFVALLVIGSMLLVACDKDDKPADTKAPTAAQTEPATDPADDTSAPAEDTSAPAEDTSAPAEDTSAPAEDTSAPAEDTSAPAEDTSAPAEDTSAPAEDTSAPAEDTSAPAEDTSAPAEDTSAPEESSTEPTDEPTAPEAETMVATPSAAILYAGFADTINGVPMENGWDTVYGYTTLDESGNATYIEIVREGVTTVDGKINFTGAAFAEGGQDKLFYSIDGVNWVEITETTYSAIEVENIFMVFWAGNHGITEAGVVLDNALYNAVIDLSAHAGETVDVYVAVRSVATHEGAQQICHLFTFNDVTVA